MCYNQCQSVEKPINLVAGFQQHVLQQRRCAVMNEKLNQTLTSVFFTLLITLVVLGVAKTGTLGDLKQFMFLVGVFSTATALVGAMVASRSKGFIVFVYIFLTTVATGFAITLFAQAAGLIGK